MKMRKIFLVIALLFTLSLAVDAQCPMCKKSVEASISEGSSIAKNLNTGILYLLALPYAAAGTLGFLWWRKIKDKE